MKCPKGNSTRHLQDSIHTRVDGLKAIVGTITEYAPFVELGTGEGVGGRTGWWVYVDAECGAPKGDNSKRYTHDEALQIYWSLAKLYGQHHVHITKGQPPQPFLQPALNESRDKIGQIFIEEIEAQLRG